MNLAVRLARPVGVSTHHSPRLAPPGELSRRQPAQIDPPCLSERMLAISYGASRIADSQRVS